MVTLRMGTIEYMGIAAATASILLCLMAGIMRGSFRVHGVISWLGLLVLGGIPAGLTLPMAGLLRLPTDQPLALAAVAFGLGLAWFHLVLPKALPDFHTDSLGASAMGGILQAVALCGAGFAGGYLHWPPAGL